MGGNSILLGGATAYLPPHFYKTVVTQPNFLILAFLKEVGGGCARVAVRGGVRSRARPYIH